MKNTVALILTIFLITAACDAGVKKKKGFEYNRVQQTEKKEVTTAAATPIDLSNKGIGPISDFEFPENIDTEMADRGAAAFKQKCTACHYPEKRLIGPAMKGVYERRHPAWVLNLLLNPTEMLEKDPIAKALLKEYNNVIMLNQNLSESEARAIVEYLRTL